MCGISGLLILNKQELHLPQLLQKMTTSLSHRGPDDEGYVLFNNLDAIPCGGKNTATSSWNNEFRYSTSKSIDESFGDVFMGLSHRRLSVIDLSSAGHQPMCNDDASVWITCNGEIYNYIELRSELDQLGHVFRTKSDIEVLLKAYEVWDIKFTEKLNGMWAFVIYDKRKNLLFGCRDRFGVKPLYYYYSEQFLAFASEQKALLALPVEKDLNNKAVFDYLIYGKVEVGESGFYSHIKELLPSHYFTFNLNSKQFQTGKYYNLSFNNTYTPFNLKKSEEYVDRIKEKVFRSVELRLRSDVPVGFCLSGGIDSSSIIGTAHEINRSQNLQQLKGNLHAFTATHGNHDCDESKWAAQVVDKYNMNWHKAECSSAELFSELETMIYYQDSPLFSTSTYAQNSVMKLAKQHGITILLDGQGGDELFAGYIPFYISFYFELMKKFRLGRLGSEWFNLNNSPLNNSILFKSLFKVILNNVLPETVKRNLYKRLHPESAYISGDLFTLQISEISLAPDYSSKSMNQWLHNFFTQYYLKNLLRWEDRCSMQYSIESRTPFADDKDLIEFVFSVPASYKIHQGWSKYLLRNAMKDVLPQSIFQRTDKLGFATPQANWLMNENLKMKKHIQELASYDTDNIVNTNQLLNNWNSIFAFANQRSTQDFVWRYMNYLMWRKVNQERF
jgi:asparagine synthase (glutamine-hydrolysing)